MRFERESDKISSFISQLCHPTQVSLEVLHGSSVPPQDQAVPHQDSRTGGVVESWGRPVRSVHPSHDYAIPCRSPWRFCAARLRTRGVSWRCAWHTRSRREREGHGSRASRSSPSRPQVSPLSSTPGMLRICSYVKGTASTEEVSLRECVCHHTVP